MRRTLLTFVVLLLLVLGVPAGFAVAAYALHVRWLMLIAGFVEAGLAVVAYVWGMWPSTEHPVKQVVPRPRVFWAALLVSFFAVAIMVVNLYDFLVTDGLRQRGTSTAAVVAREDVDYSADAPSYSYELKTVAGQAIAGELVVDGGNGRLALGQHVTVIVDPLGASPPTLGPLPGPAEDEWTVGVCAGFLVLSLGVVAVTGPRPVKREPRETGEGARA
jgi:hypothetical protein